VDRAFKMDDYTFDYVINLAGETEYGQSDEVCDGMLFLNKILYIEMRAIFYLFLFLFFFLLTVQNRQ